MRLTSALLSVALLAGCRSSSGGRAATPDAACPGPYERVTSEASGHELAVATREHPPTPEEQAVAAALWAVLVQAAHDEQLDQELFQRLAASATLAQLPSLYPTAFRPCDATGTTGAIISDPFKCSDDCRIGLNDVYALLADPLLKGLRALGITTDYAEMVKLITALKGAIADPGMSGQAIEQAAMAAVSQQDAGALLGAIYNVLGQGTAVSAAVIELAGAAELAPVVAAVGAVIGLAAYAGKLKALADKINACREWKVKNCACDAGDCPCGDLGASVRGLTCCGQGGPTPDGTWGVITASPTCCVLNRSEYIKHGDLCWTFPDRAPGACPMCRSDGECCDRLPPDGNIDRCIAGRCCGPDGDARPGTPTVTDVSCCSLVRYVLNDPVRRCAPAP